MPVSLTISIIARFASAVEFINKSLLCKRGATDHFGEKHPPTRFPFISSHVGFGTLSVARFAGDKTCRRSQMDINQFRGELGRESEAMHVSPNRFLRQAFGRGLHISCAGVG